MSDKSSIEWTDSTWNPVRGCSRVSEGCRHCYAERFAARFSGPGQRYDGLVKIHPTAGPQWTGVMRLVPEMLERPLHWKKPRRIFVNSMSDLFHEKLSDEDIDRVFDVIWQTPQHVYQVLTKRPERAVRYMRKRAWRRRFGWTDTECTPLKPLEAIHYDDIVMRNQCGYVGQGDGACDHPDKGEERGADDSCWSRECPIASTIDDRPSLEKLGVADEYRYGEDGYAEDCEWMSLSRRPLHARPGNLWLGFSAEDQATFDERYEALSQLRDDDPYLTLFCSMEPLLGPISMDAAGALRRRDFHCGGEVLSVPYLNWVIVGGESGPGARPFDVAWARSVVEQCKAAGVACFVKQLGAQPYYEGAHRQRTASEGGGIGREHNALRLRDRKGGDMDEWPEDLRVRELPEARA